MDIGTKREPGRELGKAEVKQVSGGDHLPDDILVAPGDGGCVPGGGAIGGPSGGPIVDGGLG